MRLLAPGSPDLTDDDLADLYAIARGQPWLRVNFVTSLDGAVEIEGHSAGLGSPADKAVFGLLRMLCDALVVGAGTLRHENYRAVRLDERRRAWREARGLVAYPTLVVVSHRLALDPAHPALATAPVRPVIVCPADADPGRRAALSEVADVLAVGDGAVDLPAALADLRRRGLTELLSEG